MCDDFNPFDWVPDMDLDGDHDICDFLLFEEDEEEEERKSGFFDAEENDNPDMTESDWDDEKDEFSDDFENDGFADDDFESDGLEDEFENDEFDFSGSYRLSRKAKAEVRWADPLPAPVKAAEKPNAPARTVEKPGPLYTLCFGVGLYLFCVAVSYFLLLIFSSFFLEVSKNVNLIKIILIFSLLFSAVFVGWLSIPVSKKKNVWAFHAINTVAAVLFGVLLILFIVICLSF